MAEKPIALTDFLVKTFSNIGDLILDPFSGSGTTLVSARDLGRESFGCDINQEYVEIAQKWVSNARVEVRDPISFWINGNYREVAP